MPKALFRSESQVFRGTNHWKSFRQEYGFGTGASNFLGELGGRDRVGSDLFYDLEFSQTHTANTAFYRYYISEKTALRANFSYGIVRGDDKTTNEQFRRNRNLNFRSPIIETSIIYEVHLLQEVVGRRYNLKGAKGFRNAFFDLYLYTGLAGFYFNPKGRLGSGQWYALRPLGTEGQQLNVNPTKKYSPISVAIPIGIGVTKMLGKGPAKGDWKIGFDLGVRKTFTDYIDDVSGTYYDPSELASQVGPTAAYLSNPSVENTTWFAAGQQRGDKQKVAYFYLNIVFYKNITYKDYAKARKAPRWRGRYKF